MQNAAAASNNDAHMAHSSHPSSATPSARDAQLSSFLALAEVRKRYAAPRTELSAAMVELSNAQRHLDNFKQACNHAAPSFSLPVSVAPKLATKANLSRLAPASEPNLLASEIHSLKEIEREMSQKVYPVMLEAKTKVVQYWAQQANAQRFTASAIAAHTTFVEQYAAQSNIHYIPSSQLAAASAAHDDFTFPTAAAVAHFASHLHAEVGRVVAESIEQRQAEKARKDAAALDEHKAQETVLGGAHTGETIGLIATKAATRVAKDAVAHALQASTSSTHSSATAANSSSNRSANPHAHPQHAGHKQQPKRRLADSSSNARGSGLHISSNAYGDRNVRQRSHNAKHANSTSSSNPHPKNAKGGDRPQPQRQHPFGRHQAAASGQQRQPRGSAGNTSATGSKQQQHQKKHR